jgi:hypothetical protein
MYIRNSNSNVTLGDTPPKKKKKPEKEEIIATLYLSATSGFQN